MTTAAEQTLADLDSGDPGRIEAALENLKRRRESGDEIALPLPRIEILDAFGAAPPPEIQRLFLHAVARYHAFVPPPTDAERIALMAALVLRHADFGCAYEFALRLKIAKDPVAMVGMAMDEITRQGCGSEAAARGAGYFVSNLLDGSPVVRAATLAAIRQWPLEAACERVIQRVLPQLEPDELATLGR
jgi:hypothetical protein